jgi:hypothetical protein
MSTLTAYRSRWLDWQPKTQILEKTVRNEPSKPSKPIGEGLMDTDKTIKTGFDGFDGSCLAKSPEIESKWVPEAEPSDEDVSQTNAVLSRAGVRLMRLENGNAVGIWSDLDSPTIRHALQILGFGQLPVFYLDGDVPLRYKLRRVPGEPVPAHIREEMERHSEEPWKVRNSTNWRFVPWPLVKAP